MQSVRYFLECAHAALALALPANDLETIRACMRNVLTELTHTLLELLAKDQVRTTIKSTDLEDVMQKLCDLNNTRVDECIPDELVPEILHLTEKLTTAKYDEDFWVTYIRSSARRLKTNIARVKCKPPSTT